MSVLVGHREVLQKTSDCDGADMAQTGAQVNENTRENVGLQVVRSLSLALRIEPYISELYRSTVFIPLA